MLFFLSLGCTPGIWLASHSVMRSIRLANCAKQDCSKMVSEETLETGNPGASSFCFSNHASELSKKNKGYGFAGLKTEPMNKHPYC